jgi:hypothetical protein
MRSIRLIALCLFLAACHHKQPVVFTPVAALPPAPPPPAGVPDLPVLPPNPVPRLPVAPAPVSPLKDADHAFATGSYDDAARGYEEYLRQNPSGVLRDEALFYLGMCYAVSTNADWQHATTVLKQLIDQYPDSPYNAPAFLIVSLHSQIDQLSADNKQRDQRIKQLTTEMDRLKKIDAERRRRP